MSKLNEHINQATAELYKRDFYQFFKGMWETVESEPLSDNWHIRYLCNQLQELWERVERKEPKKGNMVINIAPGSSKSSIATVAFPAWIWTRKPSAKIISGSHAQSLSLLLNTKSRDIIRSDKFRRLFPQLSLKDDDNTKGQFSTNMGGQRTATSTGSSIIGRHGDIIIVDDIIPTSATSNDIDKANGWLTQELNTRKTNKEITPIVLIMQRLAHNDPSATLLKDPNTIHIRLPAEIDERNIEALTPSHLIDQYTQIGNTYYMDTNRLSPSILSEMKLTLGSQGYASQFLQTPEPLEGGLIKKDWIPIQNKTPELLTTLSEIPTHFFIDSAYTDDESNDPTGIIGAKVYNKHLYITWAAEKWLKFPELIKFLNQSLFTNGYTGRSKIYIEQKASGLSLIQQMKSETSLNVIGDETLKQIKGSKDDRLKSVSPQLESKRVILLKDTWNDAYIQQLTSHNPVHDEWRDTTVMAINNLLLNKLSSGEYAVSRTRVGKQ